MASIWTPDGQNLTYWQAGAGLMEKRADGQGEATVVIADSEHQFTWPMWTKDRRWLVYQIGGSVNREFEILGWQPQTESLPTALVATGFSETSPALSPDERWLAYACNRNGRYEVYVRPFPDVEAAQWKVSASGGYSPMWAHNGRELFYINGRRQLVVVEVSTDPTFEVIAERSLFSISEFQYFATSYRYRGFAVTPDDQRFLMLKQVEGLRREVLLTFNWFEELKRLVPTE